MSIIINNEPEKIIYLKDLNEVNEKYAFYLANDSSKDIYLVNGLNVVNALINNEEWMDIFNLNTCQLHACRFDRYVVQVNLYVKVSIINF